MKISGMKVNHRVNPVGYDFPYLHFDWIVEDARGKEASSIQLVIQEQVPDGRLTGVYDSGRVQPDLSGGFDADYVPRAGRRYVWQVEVVSDLGETAVSVPQWFETGKPPAGEFLLAAGRKAPVSTGADNRADSETTSGAGNRTDSGSWAADWLKADPSAESVCFARALMIDRNVARARLYICGLGLYEVYIDGAKAGDEYLMPGYHSYDLMQEYQTLDVTDALSEGPHELSVILGNGWYKGRFVFEGGFENLYGDRLKLIAELQLIYADGSREVIGTDASWHARTSRVGSNSIYDGERQDYRLEGAPVPFTTDPEGKELLQARSGMPIREAQEMAPVRVLHTPAGETVLDFGEMITGWVSVYNREEKDRTLRLQYAELLQHGNFYRDNLRTARAEFVYVSDGAEKWVRPHFTYYGFRYVKQEGFTRVRAEDFRAIRLLSEIYPAGGLAAGDGSLPDVENPASGTPAQKVNRLITNVQASLKCNFLSVPTDCPQRDERMGWTGDIAVFADTACLNTDCTGFLSHFVEMVGREQTAYAVLLSFGLFRPGQEEKAVKCLKALVLAKGGHLDTGFLGTAWLCQALSEYGGHETACSIFLQEDYPGWLHEVNLGAVTTWERWNSLDENGEVSSTGMNSMNHYAYGSIAAWMYRYLCGFTPCTDKPGTVMIRPLVCPQLGRMSGSYEAPWGVYSSAWRMISDTEAEYTVTVPFGGKAYLVLPGRDKELLRTGTHTRTGNTAAIS